MSGISSVLSVIRGGGRPQPERAYIIPLDILNNDALLIGDKRYLQYFPESVTDTKGTNYENKVITGLSHPLYQWSSGGERLITFTAVFSRDDAPTQQEIDYLKSVRNNANAVAGTLGWSLGDIDPGDVGRKLSDPRNVDIPSAIAYLRSFVYPRYTNANGNLLNRPKPPPKLILGMPGMRLNAQTAGNADELCCIMQQCDVSYESFFSDGSPRLAKVQLQFAETIQRAGKINAHDAFALRNVGTAGYRLAFSNKDKTRR